MCFWAQNEQKSQIVLDLEIFAREINLRVEVGNWVTRRRIKLSGFYS